MPQYRFIDDRDGSIHEIIMGMNDDHSYITPDGYKLRRLWDVAPNANIDSTSNLNPFDSKAYVDLTAKKQGTIGDLENLSRELSEKRTDKAGQDEVKQKMFKDYSKKRGGAKCALERQEIIANITKNPIELKIK